MTLEEWKDFLKFANHVAHKHPSLFQTTDTDVLREYLSFHQLHGNLFIVDGAFMVLHPVLQKEDDFDWSQPESSIYKADVLYATSKQAVKRLLQEIAKADRKMEKVYANRRGRLIEWDARLTIKFLYGKEKSTRTSKARN
jgi:hypothetical protein